MWDFGPKTVTVLCADGRERVARYTGEADTFFSRPARVSAKGKTVRGFAWIRSDETMCFTGQGKNRGAAGLWPEQGEAA